MALFDMGQFPSSEPKRELNAVAPLEELSGVPDLNLKVVFADLGRLDADFLQFRLVAVGLGLLLLLPLGVFPLAVIHDPADRGGCLRGHLDEVHPGLTGPGQGVLDLHNAHLLVVLVDQPDGGDADAFVAAKLFTDDRSPYPDVAGLPSPAGRPAGGMPFRLMTYQK